MDISFTTTPKLEALRHEVRTWLDDELPPELEGFQWDFEEDPDRWAFYREFWKKQGAQRWLEPTWPREYGGAEMSARQARVIQEELDRRRAGGFAGIGMQVGPAILRLGTDEQKAYFLPRHGRGRDHVGRGVHRARLRFRSRIVADACGARRRRVGDRRAEDVLHRGPPLQLDDHRGADRSRRVEAAQGHQLLLRADAVPGIELRPLDNIADGRQNLVLIDGLRVPANRMLGDLNQGWQQVWFGLGGNPIPSSTDDDPGPEEEYEPGPTGQRGCSTNWCGTAGPRRGGTPLADDPVVRKQLAELAIGVEIEKLLWYEGQCDYGFHLHSAIMKEFQPEFAQTCMEILGPLGQIQRASGPRSPVRSTALPAIVRQPRRRHVTGQADGRRDPRARPAAVGEPPWRSTSRSTTTS